MLAWRIENGRVRVGERFAVSFQRTLRIPDDGRVYPLPAGLGSLPILPVADYRDRIPESWGWHDGIFIPMYQGEAMWLGFEGASWKPNAVKVGAGSINAVAGAAWDEALHNHPQDYLVCPHQPWLDGISVGTGVIRQFVAVPLGEGQTIEGQLSGGQESGGVRILVFEPKPHRFPDQAPARTHQPSVMQELPASAAMGLGAGGRMAQKIYPDPYGLDVWDPDNRGGVTAYVVNSIQYHELTGQQPPPSPVTPEMYAEQGLPWFELYDEERGALRAAENLQRVKSIRELATERGAVGHEPSIDDGSGAVEKLRPPE